MQPEDSWEARVQTLEAKVNDYERRFERLDEAFEELSIRLGRELESVRHHTDEVERNLSYEESERRGEVSGIHSSINALESDVAGLHSDVRHIQ
jgi:predicted RNase H-like nuclease (RuvC/YqgF family)